MINFFVLTKVETMVDYPIGLIRVCLQYEGVGKVPNSATVTGEADELDLTEYRYHHLRFIDK